MPADRNPFARTEIPPAVTDYPADEAVQDPPYVAEEIPGARGARMSLSGGLAPSGAAPSILTVTYDGQAKAYVTRDSWEQIGDFADLTPDDPEYRLVALMTLYAQNVLLGFETHYTDQDAIAYALSELVPHELLERDIPDPVKSARGLGLPDNALSVQNLQGLRAVLAERNAAEARARDQLNDHTGR